jgi:hypothetical protein
MSDEDREIIQAMLDAVVQSLNAKLDAAVQTLTGQQDRASNRSLSAYPNCARK